MATRFRNALLATAVLQTSALAGAAQGAEWTPPSPMPDKYDWVQLTSGEWLKSEIKVIYQSSLEFDSDKLKLLKLDMEDVKTIRSGRVVSVRVTGGRVAVGKLLLEDGQVKVLAEAPQVFERAALLSVTAGVTQEANYWSGNVSVGSNFSSGNNQRADVSVSANAQRRTLERRVTLS